MFGFSHEGERRSFLKRKTDCKNRRFPAKVLIREIHGSVVLRASNSEEKRLQLLKPVTVVMVEERNQLKRV